MIWTGSGASAAVAKLRHALHLEELLASGGRAVVFHGPFEHHSNLLPWREAPVDVIAIPEGLDGRTDQAALAAALRAHADRPLLVGTFSACSNITGVLEDQDEVTALLHAHGALAFWDFASAGPYVPVQMNPTLPPQLAQVLRGTAILKKATLRVN